MKEKEQQFISCTLTNMEEVRRMEDLFIELGVEDKFRRPMFYAAKSGDPLACVFIMTDIGFTGKDGTPKYMLDAGFRCAVNWPAVSVEAFTSIARMVDLVSKK